jgi:hypothetical protein
LAGIKVRPIFSAAAMQCRETWILAAPWKEENLLAGCHKKAFENAGLSFVSQNGCLSNGGGAIALAAETFGHKETPQ